MTRSKITRGKAPSPYDKPLSMQCGSGQSSSPRSNINHHIGEINLPGERYDNVLQVLQPRYSTPDNPEVNSEKGGQMTAPDLPTGVDSQADAPCAPDHATPPQDNSTALATPPPKPSRSVTISKTANTGTPVGGIPQGTGASPAISVCQSILLSSAKNSSSTTNLEDDSKDTPNKDRPRQILERDQKLYQVYSDDGLKETAYHVVNFAGLHPIWPILEFSMTPTGTSKDKRMASFTRCFSALLS